jgi:hypothetical protein
VGSMTTSTSPGDRVRITGQTGVWTVRRVSASGMVSVSRPGHWTTAHEKRVKKVKK